MKNNLKQILSVLVSKTYVRLHRMVNDCGKILKVHFNKHTQFLKEPLQLMFDFSTIYV